MQPGEIESLERSVVGGVAPREVLEIGGWLVPLDDGPIGRRKSAVPLRHDVDVSALDRIEAAFRARGLTPAFRIAEVGSLAPVREELARRGYSGRQPTVMKVGDVARLAACSARPARILERPDDAWKAVFLGDGFDPVEGALRVAALSGSPGALYGAAGETTCAVGVASVCHGWAGVHGMRTAPAQRGLGHASAILAAFGRELTARGVERVALQVEEANPARRIYRRAGLEAVWTYRYWR